MHTDLLCFILFALAQAGGAGCLLWRWAARQARRTRDAEAEAAQLRWELAYGKGRNNSRE